MAPAFFTDYTGHDNYFDNRNRKSVVRIVVSRYKNIIFDIGFIELVVKFVVKITYAFPKYFLSIFSFAFLAEIGFAPLSTSSSPSRSPSKNPLVPRVPQASPSRSPSKKAFATS